MQEKQSIKGSQFTTQVGGKIPLTGVKMKTWEVVVICVFFNLGWKFSEEIIMNKYNLRQENFVYLKEKHPEALAAYELKVGMKVLEVCCNKECGIVEIVELTQNKVTLKGKYTRERYLSDVGAIPYQQGWHSTNRLLSIEEKFLGKL